MAKGELREGLGHVSLVYLRPEARGKGGGRDLLQHLADALSRAGRRARLAERRAAERRSARVLAPARLHRLPPLAAHGHRIRSSSGSRAARRPPPARCTCRPTTRRPSRKPSHASPRALRGRAATAVSAPEHGWIGVYDEVAGKEPERLRKLASELSYVTGGVVLALGIERGSVVRLVAFERGQTMDEYLSVPEFYGALPPGDAMALRANPTLLARLTGGKAAAIRAAAASPPRRRPSCRPRTKSRPGWPRRSASPAPGSASTRRRAQPGSRDR